MNARMNGGTVNENQATPLPQPDDQCFHCGLPLPQNTHWLVRIDDIDRPMCCPGCQAVAQAIVEHNFDAYYRNRTEFSATAANTVIVPPEVKLMDTPDEIRRFSIDPDICEAIFSVENMRCCACVWLIEKRLHQVPGLVSAHMNVATERLQVRWIKSACRPSDILTALYHIGYAAYPFDAHRHGEQLRLASKTLSRQLFVAALSMMQTMMYSLPLYLATADNMDADIATLMHWAGLLLTIPAVAYSALPFFKGAWSNLKQGALGMDVPVALGISAAFIGSVFATVRGHGNVYYDSITMFIFLLLCSRYLELASRRKAANTLEKLQHALPAAALLLAQYPANRSVETVAAGALCEGDIILVRPGEALPADGFIVEGDSSFDVSLLTGETRALHKTAGDFLPSGALNAGQAIVVKVSKPTRDSTLSVLMKLIEHAGQAKPKLSLWADRVATWFVAVLLLFAVVVFFLWQVIDPARAWPIAIAVLVVSCPCALSLATPTALAAATDRLLHQGVLVVQSHVLETLHRVTHVIFDKTGTLTIGQPKLHRIVALGQQDESHCLHLAAALEASNAHPLSAALLAAAHVNSATGTAKTKTYDVQSLHYLPGQGLEGAINGTLYRLGRAAFVAELTGPPSSAPLEHVKTNATTQIYLGSRGMWLARFDLADPLRSDALQVVAHFQAMGRTVILLSGDQDEIAQCLAADLGIKEAHGAYLPDQKLAFVQTLQRNGAVVAMIGDGINDAAVLRTADVSFAMSTGAALAQAQADAVLLSGRLSSLMDAATTAAQTLGIIHQNLTWATLYNVIAIPAAALGLLNPWLTGIGMSVSSAIVVLNALRLRRMPRIHPFSEHASRREKQQSPAHSRHQSHPTP